MPRTIRRDEIPRWTPAGEMRHLATFYVPTTAGTTWGDRGEVSYASTTSFTAYVKLEQLGAQETAFTQQQFATATHRATMHYDSRVTDLSRFVVGSSTYHVFGRDNLRQENPELVLTVGQER